MIDQKTQKIGAGYLTNQGALFLIASDLGISLTQSTKLEVGLKDLYVGAKEISLEGRVLNISPTKEFSRKDGSSFLLRTITVYDNDSTASVKLWDDKANLPGIENLKPGDLVKIIKAYVKSDLNGSPTINIGSGSDIEPINQESKIRSIDALAVDSSEIKQDQNNLVVSGKIDGNVSTLEFTNKRGDPAKALKMSLKGNNDASTKVILWGKDETSLPKVVSQDSKVLLLGVRTKMGNQGLEIHGNDGTMVKVEGSNEIEPVILRIVAKTKNEQGKTIALGINDKKIWFMYLIP
uniref:Nucleic acid binding OB-fold tRNA/helicase-type protein (RFA1, RPA1, rpa) n=1 Tax=uncultured marine thaumarchaeote SAT1000_06_A02 TaxID=1456359 RepID=A0A075HZB5_9ARCH|nr:nucleic acid binding OB-fold tRNA/helicase-type protein (RFA1, RPA1, rpa) [uncultured marine thaumarchaeote SAT1000_06_A02]